MTDPLVSIIIPTFNRNELLKFGLKSISKQVTAFPYEIIILNEYVDDESKQLAEQFNARYILTRPNETVSSISWRCPTIAINHGVKQARGKYIIIACPEIYHLQNNTIENLITPLVTNDKLVTYTKGIDDTGNFLNSLRANVQENMLWQTAGNRPLNTEFPFFLAMCKSAFEIVGGYDIDFIHGFCWDDTNMVSRLKNSGYIFTQVSGTIVHIHHPRLRYNLADTQRLWKINEALYLARYQDKVANVGREWGLLDAS